MAWKAVKQMNSWDGSTSSSVHGTGTDNIKKVVMYRYITLEVMSYFQGAGWGECILQEPQSLYLQVLQKSKP